jgi:hypothetical protein
MMAVVDQISSEFLEEVSDANLCYIGVLNWNCLQYQLLILDSLIFFDFLL